MADFLSVLWGALATALGGEFWSALALSFVAALLVIAGLVFWRIPNPKDYFTKTEQGRGAAAGLFGAVPLLSLLCVLVVVALVLLATLFAPSAHAQPVASGSLFPGTWFNDARLYMGLDHSRKQSAQCLAGGYDDRTSSNMGVLLNVWQSSNERFRFNAKYRHNSCAINPDRNTTDAVGVEFEVLLWCRKCK